jgi:predicted RNA-binding Zn ribbon-like protein
MAKEHAAAEAHAKAGPAFVGGHPALNLMNTMRMRDGALVDVLQTDSDVKTWMRSMGFSEPALTRQLRDGSLLQSARELRRITSEAVQKSKAGKRIAPFELNDYLAKARGHLVVSSGKEGLQVNRIYAAATPEEFLAPLAESIAEYLANADFHLIRQCEGDTCVLWFEDQTKSHKRRWCVAESCGTRARVAAFRARKAAAASNAL